MLKKSKRKQRRGTEYVCSPFRNLRIREDTAKYLLNLDVNSAHYDPKTRSMREDPLPDADPNEKFYLVIFPCELNFTEALAAVLIYIF